MSYTLVRHNLWTALDLPLFIRGLQPLAIGPYAARLVELHNGVLFDTEDRAWDAAEAFMYPLGDMSRPANPDGDFLPLPFLRLPLFVPAFSTDLLAV